MIFDNRTYGVLVVSASEKFNDTLRGLFADQNYDPLYFAGSLASAKRYLVENSIDIVIVTSPLPDDMGTRLAIDISNGKYDTVCLFLAKSDIFDDVNTKLTDNGVFCLSKPIVPSTLMSSMNWMKAARERLRKFEKKSATLEEKMEEIRLVNRAKWLLIEKLNMSEPDAHRYIEKQAMDRCVAKRAVAESIIETYGKV